MLVRYVCYKVWVTARVQLKNDQHLYPINADPHRHIRTTIQSIIKFISCIFPEFLDFHPQVLWELWLFQSGPLQISHDVGIHRLNPRLRNPHQGQLWWRRQPGSRNGRTLEIPRAMRVTQFDSERDVERAPFSMEYHVSGQCLCIL